MKVYPALIGSIALGLFLAVIMFTHRYSNEENRTCTDEDGCIIKVAFQDNLTVIEGRVTRITMKLTADQAAALNGDPYDKLTKVKSILVTFPSDQSTTCQELESRANTALATYAVLQAWEVAQGDKTPITLCDHLAPTPTPRSTAVLAGVS